MGKAMALLRRLVVLASVTLCYRAGAAHTQASQLPPRSLTGPNGEYIHDSWRGSRGEFPDVSVSALAQDSLGFLLVASPRGIYRFDGRQFLGPWGFPFNGAERLVIDQGGSLWASSQSVVGLARRRPNGDAKPPSLPNQTMPVGPVDGLTIGSDGSVYFSTQEGIFTIRGGEPALVSPHRVRGPLVVSPGGTLWAGANGLMELQGDSLVSRTDLRRAGDGTAPTALMFDRTGQLWLGDKDGLVVVSTPTRPGGGTLRRFPRNRLGVAGAITALMEDDLGQIWIGTAGGGITRFSEGRFTSLSSGEALSDDGVEALLQDRSGNIWIGTRGGLDRLRPRAIRNITVREGLPSNDVWSVAVEADGGVLVGTRVGVSRIRSGRITPVRAAGGAAVELWSGALEPRRDGATYFGSDDSVGAWRLDSKGKMSGWKPPGRDSAFHALTFLSDPDGTLWTGGSGPVLYRVRDGSAKEYRDPTRRMAGFINDITRDSVGTVWFTADALYRVVGDSVERVCESSEQTFVPVLFAGRAGLWVGTGMSTAGGGAVMTLFREGRCLLLHGKDLPTVDVYSIENDPAGHLWVAASEGLLRYQEAELARRAVDSTAPLNYRLFDRLDGLLSAEFNSAGDSPSAVTPDGMMLYASAGGLVVLDPARLPTNPVPPRPLILAVALNDSAWSVDRPIAARLGVGKLEFEFTAPSLSMPERLRLEYRLDGKDTDWVDAGDRRRIAYAGLRGGNYKFRVRATNEDGVRSLGEAQLSVRLAAPFTSTWPFYLVLAALLLGTGLGVGAIRNRLIAQRERLLAQLVEQRTRELADARDRLEERVLERTAALAQESAERLKVERDLHEAQRMESVGRLAGGVAHDLNNMLAVILGNAEILRGQTPSTAELEEIVSAGDRATRLTSQLLAFARRQVGQPQVLHLDRLARDIATMLRRLSGEQITTVFEFAPGLWSIWADRGQVEQVLVNLTMNARDAMPGGGTLTIGAANVRFTDTEVQEPPSMPAGEYVRLVVTDTGVGIEPQILAHIFEPFFTTKEVGKGTGLGLASCYGIAHQWGGQIAVTSTLGKGTTIALLFPRSQREEPVRPAATAPSQLPNGRGERVLVVDDEPMVRFLTRQLLESAGYTVTEAVDGEEAVARLAEPGPRFDLVVSDVVMPRMNGKALADHIQRTRPDLAVLLMTGYSRGMLAENGLLDQAYRVIEKPFDRATLLVAVREALNR